MTIDEVYKAITQRKPSIIYISGKTSTGKSTFGRKLQDRLGYHMIELESILLEIVKEHGLDEQATFRKVLYEPGEFEEKTLFLEATDKIISRAIAEGKLVAIEGSVADAQTLKRILLPARGPFFLYFHPSDIQTYIRHLTKRFLQSSESSYGSLPLKFWQLVDKEEFEIFCRTRVLSGGLKDSIKQFAQSSQKESLTRLGEFQGTFKSIIVVEI